MEVKKLPRLTRRILLVPAAAALLSPRQTAAVVVNFPRCRPKTTKNSNRRE